MIPITVTLVGAKELGAKLRGLKAKLKDALRQVSFDQGWALVNYIKANKLSGQVLHARTGNLRRSITCRMEDSRDEVRAHVGIFEGPALLYGRAHEFGATIRPKKGQFLTIPIAGWAKGHAAPEFDLHYQQTAGGQPYLATATGEMAFLLRRKVVLPERSFLRSGLADRTPAIKKAYEDAIAAALAGKGVRGL